MNLRDERSFGVTPIGARFLSTKNCSITSIMAAALAGSASGVTTVAKCSSVSLTPATRGGSRPFR